MEAARSFGQKRTPYAAMSRGVAGFIDRSLVVTLPGSRGGASESMAAILPALVHIFDVTGEIRAGSESHDILSEGQAIRIFTGGKIPEGTTHVARQEIVEVVSAQEILLTEHIRPKADIRFTGEEIQQGQLLAQVGQFLNIGSLAALITGDEVAEKAEDLAEGKIFDANGPLLKAWFEDYGLEVELIHVQNEAVQVTHYFNKLKDSHDVIITTGGVSGINNRAIRLGNIEECIKMKWDDIGDQPCSVARNAISDWRSMDDANIT
uniref:Molybdopterin adenylyltransferase n=1 Tax=Ditylenchus dipsaci TaxID=166011 RepID=A0A915DVN2_9BILA